MPTIYEIDRAYFARLAATPLKKPDPLALNRPDLSKQVTRLTNCENVYATARVFAKGHRSIAWDDNRSTKPRKGQLPASVRARG